MKRGGAQRKVAHGQLRRSQMITTFGPGAPVDLPNYSVLVGGLEQWQPIGAQINEPRLLQKIQALFPELHDLRLHAPPVAEADEVGSPGVGVWLFPQWFLTVDSVLRSEPGTRSRRLVHRNDVKLSQGRRAGGSYEDEDRVKHELVPIRFVRACVRGHIADIDWYLYVHGVEDRCRRALWLDEFGTSGDVGSLEVRCDCKAHRKIMDAAKPRSVALGLCGGDRPWLGPNTREHCGERSRLLVRTASNAYFTQSMSVISLPPQDERLQQVIEPLWEDFLQYVDTKELLAQERGRKHKVKQGLAGHSDDEIWNVITARRGGGRRDRAVKQDEFDLLASSTEEVGTDQPDGDYFARALPAAELRGRNIAAIEKVVLVHRLREVQALVGFTRFESISPNTDGDLDAGVSRAALAREPTWFPAVETRGEGIFLHLRDAAVRQWSERAAVRARATALADGFEAWRHEHERSKREFCGIEYLLLHSLSHLLLTSVALGCGYPASSIRERVYALPGQGYGILLYTASSDADGTLGGLVEVGRRIGPYLDDALELGRLCSNDQVCAQHDPKDPHEQRFLHGAACHGCLLIAETSCEQRNDFLDRALVVPTVDDSEAAFFTGNGS